MAKIAHINGLVRSVRTLTKNDTGEAFATILTVLSEPDGETVDVTAWPRSLPVADAPELKGLTIDATVEIGTRTGRNGGAFLEVSLVALDSAEAA